MAWWWDLIKEALPWVKDTASGMREAAGYLKTKNRKKRHLFVLKAITSGPSWISISPFDQAMSISEIDYKIMKAQIEYASNGPAIPDRKLTKQEEESFRKQLKKLKRIGIPHIDDPRREAKIENILQDMVEEGKLKFHPPEKYEIKD